jgi:hypothetical protein
MGGSGSSGYYYLNPPVDAGNPYSQGIGGDPNAMGFDTVYEDVMTARQPNTQSEPSVNSDYSRRYYNDTGVGPDGTGVS